MPGVRPNCVVNRWGKGTCSTQEPKTEAAKEIEAKLDAMKAERDNQDEQLYSPPNPLKTQK